MYMKIRMCELCWTNNLHRVTAACTRLLVIVKIAFAKWWKVDILNTSDNSFFAASFLNNLSNTFNHFKVLSINIDHQTTVIVIVFDVARESDFDILNNIATLNLSVQFHLREVSAVNNGGCHLLAVGVNNSELITLLYSLDSEGKALGVAVGPEIAIVEVESVAFEGQASAVSKTDRLEPSGLSVKQILVGANVANVVPEAWGDAAVYVKPCK